MARIKLGVNSRRRHNKVLQLTKGQRATRHNLYKRAHEAMLHSLDYAYVHRRERKGDMRRLWVSRINAGCRANGISYSHLVHALKESGYLLNRKTLADMTVREPQTFTRFIENLKAS